jgi:RNA polymerase sigma-70 factor (ECF subfamily)
MVGQVGCDAAPCDPPPDQLESWIQAARRGDRDALGQALLSLKDYLLLVAKEELEPALRAKGGASDLVQETFCRAQRGFPDFRGRSAAERRGWLRSILVRHLANHRRQFWGTAKRRAGREVMSDQEVGPGAAAYDQSPSRELARREQGAALMEALERLPEHYRQVVIWHHREGLPFEEIGRRRGISAEAARKLWTRALGCLRKELGPSYDRR